VEAAARAEVTVGVAMRIPASCRLRPVAIELVVGDRSYGQVAEALVTVERG
jgi:hypothetical protein